MRKNILLSLLLFAAFVCTCPAQSNTAEAIIKTLNDPSDKNVIVVAHRGDWRNFPENSAQAVESAIEMGVDIIEIDLAMTSDSILVLMHDRTVDRTTDGNGPVVSYTLDSLRKLRLKDHSGKPTQYAIPTFEEIMLLSKGRAVINVDKGFQYYGMVHEILEKTGTTRQVLIKSGHEYAKIKDVMGGYSEGSTMMYMPIINFNSPGARKVMESYLGGMHVIAYEIVFKEFTPEIADVFLTVRKNGSRVWVNTMWNSLCGTNDDRALEDQDAVYGKFLKEGATIFQTDRPELLIGYLRSKGLHR